MARGRVKIDGLLPAEPTDESRAQVASQLRAAAVATWTRIFGATLFVETLREIERTGRAMLTLEMVAIDG